MHFERFSLVRSIFFFIYDFPVYCLIFSAVFCTFFFFEISVLKKSHIPNSIGGSLWVAFMVTSNLLFFFIHAIFILSNPTHGQIFSGVYTYLILWVTYYRSPIYFVILAIANIVLMIVAGNSYIKKNDFVTSDEIIKEQIRRKVTQ